MSEQLPFSSLLETSIYEEKIGDDTIVTRVADRVDLMIHGITELRRELKSPNPVVVIDFTKRGDMLCYVEKRCLLIRYKHILALNNERILVPLLRFLDDTSITFVGPLDIGEKLPLIGFWNVVDVGILAEKILKKPEFPYWILEELNVGKAWLDIINSPVNTSGAMGVTSQSSSVLSVSQDFDLKYSMCEVVKCYKLATKLMGGNYA